MLLTLFPLPDILPTIGPTKRSEFVFLIILVFALIYFAVRPLDLALAEHLIVLPLPDVLAVLEPVVGAFFRKKNTLAVNLVFVELAYVVGAVVEFKDAGLT